MPGGPIWFEILLPNRQKNHLSDCLCLLFCYYPTSVSEQRKQIMARFPTCPSSDHWYVSTDIYPLTDMSS